MCEAAVFSLFWFCRTTLCQCEKSLCHSPKNARDHRPHETSYKKTKKETVCCFGWSRASLNFPRFSHRVTVLKTAKTATIGPPKKLGGTDHASICTAFAVQPLSLPDTPLSLPLHPAKFTTRKLFSFHPVPIFSHLILPLLAVTQSRALCPPLLESQVAVARIAAHRRRLHPRDDEYAAVLRAPHTVVVYLVAANR